MHVPVVIYAVHVLKMSLPIHTHFPVLCFQFVNTQWLSIFLILICVNRPVSKTSSKTLQVSKPLQKHYRFPLKKSCMFRIFSLNMLNHHMPDFLYYHIVSFIHFKTCTKYPCQSIPMLCFQFVNTQWLTICLISICVN